MSEPTDDTPDERTEPSGSEGQPPRKRRRRRGRKRARSDEPASTATAEASSTLSSLTAGLFSHIDERQIPCKVEGCTETWIWTAEEQIRAFGQAPPKRMCAEHVAQFHALTDREVPCADSGCTRTWLWSRGAQVTQLQRSGSDRPPSRLCDVCKKAERTLGGLDVACRIEGCGGTWHWSREAQLEHRARLRRSDESGGPTERSGTRRRRKRRRGATEGPPARLCDRCRARSTTLIEREVQCKVHGCTRTVIVDRESQLRAWVSLGIEDLEVEPPALKRMCEVCREFCRLHGDREVLCGRPACDRTWTYKTGAQLQTFLAGRLEDPVRLCADCQTGAFAASADDLPAVPAGAEVMPCVIPGCGGVWFFRSGMTIAPAEHGDLPLDRMCDDCLGRRQAPRRNQAVPSRQRDDQEKPKLVTEDGVVGAEPLCDDPVAQERPS